MFALFVGAVSVAGAPSLALAQHGHGHGGHGYSGHGHGSYGHGGYGHGVYGHGNYGHHGHGLYGLDVHLGPLYLHGRSYGHYHGAPYYYSPAPICYGSPPIYYPSSPPVVLPAYPPNGPIQVPPISQGGSIPIPAPQVTNGNGGTAPPVGKALPYGGQKTCPVTGEELGSHGAAIPVSIQGQTIYVCCESCVNAVRRNPGAYLPKVEAERKAVIR